MGWLAFYRETLAIKCDGLSDEQVKVAAVPPSNLSLLGLVRHLTDQEVGHLVWGRCGGALELPYWSKEHEGADFDDVAGADVAKTFATWRATCDRSNQLIADAESLDAPRVTGCVRLMSPVRSSCGRSREVERLGSGDRQELP